MAAHQADATEQQLRDILATGLGYAHFQYHEHRAQGLEVTTSDIDHPDLGLEYEVCPSRPADVVPCRHRLSMT